VSKIPTGAITFIVLTIGMGTFAASLVRGIGDGADLLRAAAFMLAALLALFIVIGGPVLWDNLLFALRDGKPTCVFRSRSRPPWQFPRRLSETGSRRDRADFRMLKARLVEDPASNPGDPDDYLAPTTFRDRETGQKWVEKRLEAGFNQWSELTPE
jgi:hypothetical protein